LRKERDAAGRSCYPLAIDQDRFSSINFVKSINFSLFQKIRTLQRKLVTGRTESQELGYERRHADRRYHSTNLIDLI